MRLPAAVLTCLLSLALVVCAAEESAPGQAAAASPDAAVTLPVADLEPALPLSAELAAALAAQDHAAAAPLLRAMDRGQLRGKQAADLAFLQAWSLLRAGQGAPDAGALFEAASRSERAPAEYLHLTLGELLLASGRAVEASEHLARVPPSTPIYARARMQLAAAHYEAGATAESLQVYEGLAARPDPAEGSEKALLALAARHGIGSPQSYPLLRRIWARYPGTPESREAGKYLASYESQGARYKPTLQEIAQRAYALMENGNFKGAIDLLQPRMASLQDPSAAACLAWYTYGRSKFKNNDVTEAAAILGPAGERCAGIDDDNGARALYVAGKALERKKEWSKAATAFEKIPKLYPKHSMADDGYTLAGIGWQEGGDLQRAMKLWAAGVAQYPEGDLAPEGYWRLAWNSYRQGDPAKAVEWAEKMAWSVPVDRDPVHVLAGRYWAARWKIYPDVQDPTRRSSDAKRSVDGINDLLALCREHPESFYALLAGSRLHEIAPEKLDALPRPRFTGDPDRWRLDPALAENPAVKRAIGLAQLGLVPEALAELDAVGEAALGPAGMSLYAAIGEREDWVKAHDKLHKYLLNHPPSTYAADQLPILRQAHPDRYWDLVQKAAAGYRYDPRIFHALVREESSFNPTIVSWAGARGLSQLMPATARQVGGWLNMQVTDQTSFDPYSNLRIGSRYLEFLHQRFGGNSYLATAGYNAGEGNVDKWLANRGNKPSDEFIEDIPFRETRGYVKRVLGTYQVYHLLYDGGDPFPDWSAYNHKAKP